ncbi:MAG: hypothetical protein A6D91_05540 [Bacillaceae bacterium G1]|nr:MAG: hypothetical protein A6D91_05540 [Bacillaceae bacterium G1]
MPRIAVLPEQVANQIAAGEVIERPASVVKELVENAIDAGSTQIDVRAEEAGLTLIEVRDNGSGIEPDECLLAFERHATSKIRSSKDLFRIATLGFRGEALASIAAVSKLRMITATSTERPGVQVVLEGGEVREQQPVAAARGTTVQVRDLFYNTPARLKYLKSQQTELAHIHDVLARLALGHPDIAFRFHHQGRLVFSTDGDGRLLHVIHALYGLATSREMIGFREETPDFEVTGYISKPVISRSNRSHIYWIVNGRAIKSVPLTHALLEAYHTLLMQRRYPIAVIHLRMDPQLVDVNVHPAKLEVRFSKEAELVSCIKEAVRRALRQEPLIPQPMVKKTRPSPASVQMQLELMRPPASVPEANVRRAPSSHQRTSPAAQPADRSGVAWSKNQTAQSEHPPRESSQQPVEVVQESPVLHLPYHRSEATNLRLCAAEHAEAGSELDGEGGRGEHAAAPHSGQTGQLPELYPLGQFHGTYILAQNENGLYLIDQHAAQERIFYEQLAEQAHAVDVQRQPLLIPLTVHLHPKEASLLNELWTLRKEEILKLGLELEPFGQHTFLVRSYPSWIPASEEDTWLQQLFQLLLDAAADTEPGRLSIRDVWDELLKSVACKKAIKANRHLSVEEMTRLLDDLRRAQQPYTCPHGRPVLILFTPNQIKRMFKRLV